jgi:undecaprenyl-diphosphatase
VSLLQSLILGIIQGITEFLPISSSAHLVLIPHLLGWKIPEAQVFPFDVLVQLGTLIAVILYFWKDLWQILKGFFQGLIERKPFGSENARLGWYLILATIPAGLAGVLIKDQVEAAFNSPTATAIFLFVTALFLVLAELVGKRSRPLSDVKWVDALWVGVFQAISLFPGISRSGSTITGGMTRNLDRPSAARFSFLMSVPVMLGAGLVSFKDALQMPGFSDFLPVLAVGFTAALLVGYLVIHWLLSYLNKGSLYIFAVYCVILGTAVLLTGTVKGNANLLVPQQKPTAISAGLPPKTTPQTADANTLSVSYTASLSWLSPAMSACAETIPGLSIITNPPLVAPGIGVSEPINLRWGAPNPLADYAAEIGTERLAVIVHPENSLSTLPLELVSQIASGELSTWGSVYAKCPECFTSPLNETFAPALITLVFYPPNEEPQQLFMQVMIGNKPVATSIGIIVPGSTAMRETISANPDSFGFMGSRFLDDSVKEIAIQNLDAQSLEKPILAISKSKLAGNALAWLLCIQKILTP